MIYTDIDNNKIDKNKYKDSIKIKKVSTIAVEGVGVELYKYAKKVNTPTLEELKLGGE